MKKISIILLVGIILLTTVGCSSKSAIIGTWEGSEGHMVYTFNKDGTWDVIVLDFTSSGMVKSRRQEQGTYKISKNQ